MAGLWQAPQLPLITLVVLVAVSDQFKRRTFFSVTEMTAVNEFVPETLYFLNDEYNRHSKDVYSFRILRVLQVQMWVGIFLPPSPPWRWERPWRPPGLQDTEPSQRHTWGGRNWPFHHPEVRSS